MKFLNQQRKSGTNTSSTPIRMKIILGVIFVLFALLIAQLVYLQLIYGSRFKAEVQKTDSTLVHTSVPRGVMYDDQGRVLVGNKANNAITYTKGASTTPQQAYRVANGLSKYITISNEKPTDRQIGDYYLANTNNLKRETAKLQRSKRVDKQGNALDNSVIYQNVLDEVAHQHIHFTKREKTAAIIFNKISGAFQLSTIYLKNKDLTDKEVALVGEHLSELPGVGIGTDWQRDYPNGSSIRSIIGSVSSEKAGLPSDNLQYYLSQGYSRNDRVGTSYLEQEYEPLLKGSKAASEVTTKSNGQILQTRSVYHGQPGASLMLTLDSQYQKQVQDALNKVYSSAIGSGAARLSDGAYAIALDPNTGAIKAIAGINHNPKTQKTQDDALGIINRSFVMGSAVKGATVAGGLMNHVISPGSSFLPDTPIYLPGSPVKKSVYPIGTFGSLNAQSALEVSSNIYMMQLALRWVKAKYVPHTYISMPKDAFSILRRNFNMFGLGQKTGIDLPGEIAGIQGPSFNSKGQLLTGSVLDLAYGNYDAYTPIQMAQYISTIANGGYRMQPYLVQAIGQTDKAGNKVLIDYNKRPNAQLRIPWTADDLNVIHQGMYAVVHGSNAWGTAHPLKDVKPEIAGKTGTAETFYYDPDNPGNPNAPELINATFVGYAPADKPKLAIVVVMPGLDPNMEGTYTLQVAQAMVQNYFKEGQDKDNQDDTTLNQ